VKEKREAHIVTLGVQAVVLAPNGHVLLIEHRYRPGWHFPGGGVEHAETVDVALARELEEETGIRPTSEPKLVGFYAHFDEFPGDHIALYRVVDWVQARPFKPGLEIANCAFFALNALPTSTTRATRARLDELFHHAPISAHW